MHGPRLVLNLYLRPSVALVLSEIHCSQIEQHEGISKTVFFFFRFVDLICWCLSHKLFLDDRSTRNDFL